MATATTATKPFTMNNSFTSTFKKNHFKGSIPHKEKNGTFMRSFSCLSVKTLFIRNAWRYQAEIYTKYLALLSLRAVKNVTFKPTQQKDMAVYKTKPL